MPTSKSFFSPEYSLFVESNLSNSPFSAANNWILLPEALWLQYIEVRVADFVRYQRIDALQACIKLLVTVTVRPRKKARISETFELAAGPNESRTLVVLLAATVRVAEQADFVGGSCVVSIATP